MYEYISGKVAELTPTYAVIDCSGVGYFLNISLQTYSEIGSLSEFKLYVHYIVREDVQVFYGFSSKQERELFRSLISVSGVGGGTARMILSTYQTAELENIIVQGNSSLLSKVKGLGVKTSQKIIVELRDKIQKGSTPVSLSSVTAAASSASFDEAVAALLMLGFTKQASEKAILSVIKENPAAAVEQVVRLSLKKM
ncbi:MAG: Holliday junction branch migration protein RuvA [Rikenellaceae bacterium]